MPKITKPLTKAQVDALKQNGRYAVGGVAGLHLLVAGKGRSWILRIKIGNRRTDIGLGSYQDISLYDARTKARDYRSKVIDGRDPIAEQRAEKLTKQKEALRAKTFRECAEAVIENKRHELKNAKALAQWSSTMMQYVYPIFDDDPVSEIEQADILNVLEPIWRTKSETARRIRGRIQAVLDYAKAMGFRTGDNPAEWQGSLKPILGEIKRNPKHHASMDYRDAGEFMAELRTRKGIAARALEFTVLTAARSGEARGATWEEIDLERCLWTIPANRMKAGKEHAVPLSDAAVALLRALSRIEGSDNIFPAATGRALSDMTLSAVLKRMGSNVTVHGFRSTFREWAGETTAYSREVIEHALAHQLADKSEAAYQRGSLFPKRIRLMADWASYCAMIGNSESIVVGIKRDVA